MLQRFSARLQTSNLRSENTLPLKLRIGIERGEVRLEQAFAQLIELAAAGVDLNLR